MTYNARPTTLEFGSFMLEPRNISQGQYIRPPCYGICSVAMLIDKLGPAAIDIKSPLYARGDANNFFSHLAFEIGEHHSNTSVADLVAALYRYVGLSQDPPDEFNGAFVDSDDDGFAVIEIGIKAEPKGGPDHGG